MSQDELIAMLNQANGMTGPQSLEMDRRCARRYGEGAHWQGNRHGGCYDRFVSYLGDDVSTQF